MKKYIPVTKEEREKLAKIFKCSERMVYFALTYDPKRGKTNLARKIRHTAKKSGFCVYVVAKEMVERENLAPLDYTQSLSSHEKAPIDHRRFQLQVLMDVAYIRGGLEGYDIVRKVSQDAQALADIVYSRSDGSEADMCRVIDEIYNS